MQNEIIKSLRAALEAIKAAAEAHPCFCADPEEAEKEGGDMAFVTLSIAKVAREALEWDE